jgi:hypothetical protein
LIPGAIETVQDIVGLQARSRISSGLHPDTLHASQSLADETRTSRFGRHPRPRLPRRIVPHVLRVAALELGNPMSFIILMEADDPSWNR